MTAFNQFPQLAAADGASNVNFTQSGSGAVTRDVQSKLRESVSAKDFGAVGNGVADDTLALQRGIQHVAANGGVLYIPEGVYRVTQTINLGSAAKSFTIQGAGKFSTTIRRASSNVVQVVNIGNCSNWSIFDLAIDGGNDTYPTNASHGLAFFNGSNIAVERLHVYNYNNTGIIGYHEPVTTVDNHNYIKDCLVDGLDNANNGILIAGMWASHIIDCNAVRIGKTGSPCYALQLKNASQRCSIRGGLAEGAKIGVAVGTNTAGEDNIGNIITGVHIKNCNTGLAFGAGGTNDDYTWVNYGHAVGDVVIDMSDSGENAVDFNIRTRLVSIKNLQVRNIANNKFGVRFREGDSDNTVEFGLIDNRLNRNIRIAYFGTASVTTPAPTSNVVKIHKVYNPTNPYDEGAIVCVNDSGDSSNKVFYDDVNLAPFTQISSGAIDIVHGGEQQVKPIPEGAVGSTPIADDLTTINGGQPNQVIILSTRYNTHSVTVRHNAAGGNIWLANSSDMLLGAVYDTLVLRKQFDSAITPPYYYWSEVSRSALALNLTVVSGTTVNAVAGAQYVLTNASATTVTLPANPNFGDTVGIVVANNRFDNVVARNGNRIMGLTEDLTLTSQYVSITLRFVNPTLGWRLV